MKIPRRIAIFLSGFLWTGIGIMLMTKGIRLLMTAQGPLINKLLPLAGEAQQAVLLLALLSLVIGTLKGRTVLARAARKMIDRFAGLPDPIPLSRIYPARYYILLGCMMSLGVIRRLSGVADDIGGVVDLAVGSALVQGSIVFYKALAARSPTYDKATGGK